MAPEIQEKSAKRYVSVPKRGRKPQENAAEVEETPSENAELQMETLEPRLTKADLRDIRDEVREVDVDAARLEAKDKLPPRPKGKWLTAKQAMEWLELLTPEMWEGMLLYVYRTYPYINVKLVDPDATKYIDVITGKFDPEYMVKRHGGGSYQILVNDQMGKHNLFEFKFEVDYSRYDPILDYEMLDVGHPKNRAYVTQLRARGILDAHGKVMAQVGTPSTIPGAASADANAMFAKEVISMWKEDRKTKATDPDQQAIMRSIDTVAKAGEKGMELLLSKVQQEDPAKWLTMVKTVLDISGVRDKSDSTATTLIVPLITSMVEQQKSSQQMMIELMKGMMESNKKAAEASDKDDSGDDLDKIEKLLRIARMLGGRGGPESTTDRIVDALGNALPSIANGITSILALKGANPQQALAMQQAMAAHATQAAGATYPALATPATMPTGETTGLHPLLAQQLAGYGDYILDAMSRGVPGEEFADSLQVFSMDVYRTFANVGTDDIVATMQTVPTFWTRAMQLYKPEFVRDWVDRFVRADEILSGDVGDEGDESDIQPNGGLERQDGKTIDMVAVPEVEPRGRGRHTKR